jgi:DNA polymerase
MLERIQSAPGVEIPLESVYATSVVPWRLLRDRFPRRHEIASRRDTIVAELEKVQPLVIVALGELSAYALFADRPFEPGEWRTWENEAVAIPVYQTLHPREALWNHIGDGRFIADARSKKRRMWDDWRAIAEKLAEQRHFAHQLEDQSKENR